MSKNINQVFGTNPATSMQDTDLFYLGRAPYGLTNDMAILWSNVVASIGGEFLKKANNFTDVADPAIAFKNLGTGTGESITINDGDFTLGVYQIPVPFPAFIVCSNLTAGQEIRLPVANTPFDSPALGQGPILKMIDCGATDIALSDGTVIDNLEGFEQSRYLCNNKSTAAGGYTIEAEVYLVNSVSGRIELHSPENTIYVGTSTSTGATTGSITNPYPTLSAALAAITPTAIRPYRIIMDTGIYTETDLLLKPWVDIQGSESQLTVSGSVDIDPSWSGGGFLYFQNFSNLSWPDFVTFDFDSAGSPFSYLNFSNNIFTSYTVLSVFGEAANGATVIINNNFGLSGQFSYNLNDCSGIIQGGTAADINILNYSDTTGNKFAVGGMTEIANFSSWTFSSTGLTLFFAASNITGTASYKANSSGTLNISERGIIHNGTLTLDNGTGGGFVNFSSDTLTALPLLLNGASYNPDSIADAMNANAYFNPVNYTPVSGGPGSWQADSVTGNLAGIDAALASAPPGMASAYAETYFQANTTPTTFAGANTPTKVLATTYNTGEIQGFTQVGGTFTYTDTPNRILQISAMVTASYAGTGQNTSFYITKNGTPLAKSQQSAFIDVVTPANKPLPVQAKSSVSTGDTFELWVENNDNTNAITVYDVNFGIEGITGSSAQTVIPPSYGEMYFQDNVTPTTIAAANTPVKIDATYNAGLLKDFSHSSGTLTYTDTTIKQFLLSADLTATYDGTAQNTSFYIAVNGTVVGKSKQKTFIGDTTPGNRPNPCKAFVTLSNADTVEVWVENNDNANDIIVTDFNFTVQSIDGSGTSDALPQVIIDGMTATGFAGTSSVTVLGSHEVKLANLVVGSIKLLFTSTSNAVNIHATKSFGSSFSALEQAIGSGICAKSVTTAIGDASVQIVQAVLFDTVLEITMDVNGNDTYKAEINFTYEVT